MVRGHCVQREKFKYQVFLLLSLCVCFLFVQLSTLHKISLYGLNLEHEQFSLRKGMQYERAHWDIKLERLVGRHLVGEGLKSLVSGWNLFVRNKRSQATIYCDSSCLKQHTSLALSFYGLNSYSHR